MLGVGDEFMRIDDMDFPSAMCLARVSKAKTLGASCRASVGGRPSMAGALWARGITGKSKALLALFNPRPTMVFFDSKVKFTAFWALQEPRSEVSVEVSNEKLAYCLRSRKKDASPDTFAINLHDSVLDEFNCETHDLEDVVKYLPNSPGWSGGYESL